MNKEEHAVVQKVDAKQERTLSPFGPIKGTNYSNNHWAVIRGETALEDASTLTLGNLYKKAVANGDTLLAEAVKPVWELKRAQHPSRKPNEPNPYGYTLKQKAIVDGLMPMSSVSIHVLIPLRNKAIANGDIALAEKINTHLNSEERKTGLQIPSPSYTKKQMDIISGKIPMASVSGHVLTFIYKKALANNDQDLAKKVKRHMYLKEVKRTKCNSESAKARALQFKNGETIEWHQPKSNNYSDRQKRIVKGEIPYASVRTSELVKIYQKAHNNGDYELSERLYDLIRTRKLEACERAIERSSDYNDTFSEGQILQRLECVRSCFEIREKADNFDAIVDIDTLIVLSNRDKAALWDLLCLENYDEDRVSHILEIAKLVNDEEIETLIESTLESRTSSDSLCVANGHREAIDMIEELFGLPIRRPETWFTE